MSVYDQIICNMANKLNREYRKLDTPILRTCAKCKRCSRELLFNYEQDLCYLCIDNDLTGARIVKQAEQKTIYNQEQIKESINGYLWYDAPWGIIRTVYPFIGESCLDIGSGSGIMQKVFKALKEAENKTFRYGTYEEDYKDLNVYETGDYDTIFTSHVLEHVARPFELINKSISVCNRMMIHIVPDGDVEDKNLGSEHLHIFDRVSFLDLFKSLEISGYLKRVHYGPIKGDRMDSLMYVAEVVR